MKTKKLVYFSFLLVFALMVAVGSVYAADFRVAGKDAGNVYVGQNESVKNLYTAGNMVSVDSNVERGVYAAGNVLTINGNVGGSAHVAGGSVVVNGGIADDLFVAGGNIVIANSAAVGGDLIIGGGTIDIQGPVRGNVYIGGGVVSINSEINGNVKIGAADKIKLGSSAKINGNLEYNSKNTLEKDAGAVVLGNTKIIEGMRAGGERTGKGPVAAIIFAIFSIAALVKVGGVIAIGLLLMYFFKNQTEEVVREGLNNFWKNLGYGLLYVIATPIVAILLMVTLVGLCLGVIVALLYVISLIVAAAFAGITFGAWAWGVIKKNKDYMIDWKIVVGGALALAIIKLVPVLGGLFGCVFTLISLGAIYQLARNAVRQEVK